MALTPTQDPRRYRVLVVEDEGLIAHDISKRVEALGHSVVGTASTAEEAVELAAEAELVLMDIRIDGERDGIEAAAEIRARFRIPVVFLTAHADRSTLDRAKAVAPYGYMVKPMGPATLQATIEIAVHKHAMERELEQREAWLRTTVAAAAEAILAADHRSRILLMNAAAEALTGVPVAEAKGRPLGEVLRLVDSRTGQYVGDIEAIAMLREAATPLDAGLEAVSRTGLRRTVEGSVAPVRTADGIAGVVVSLHDVTTQRWQERRVRQAQRTESAARLAASVAGEFANLVGTIRNRAGQLLTQFGEYSPARNAIEEIQQAALGAEQITKRLEAFGTREPGRPELLSLGSVVRKLSRVIESIGAGRLTVTVVAKPGAGRILADAAQLEQAIMSLAIHAASASGPGGTLVLETAQQESHASLKVTYPAMEDDLDRLFDPARQAGEDTLGLAVTQAIVAAQSGLIHARPLADGTEIEVLFPIALEAPKAFAAAASPAAAPSIVLVEPRERVRAQLHNAAEAAGYNLLEAASAEEAATLLELRDRPVDFLIAPPADAQLIVETLEAAKHPRSVVQLEAPYTQSQLLRLVEGARVSKPDLLP